MPLVDQKKLVIQQEWIMIRTDCSDGYILIPQYQQLLQMQPQLAHINRSAKQKSTGRDQNKNDPQDYMTHQKNYTQNRNPQKIKQFTLRGKEKE